MPLFTSLEVYGLTLYIHFHIGVDDAEYIIDAVSVRDSAKNIFDILSEDVIHQIEEYIGENLDQIIENNRD